MKKNDKNLRIFNILGVFVGLSNVFMINPYFLEEKNLPFVYFYYLIDIKAMKIKIKDHILQVLNTNEDRFFEKEDIEEIVMLNQFINESTKRVFMIKLKISKKVLTAEKPMIYEVLLNENIEKKTSKGKRSASKELNRQIEKEIEKDVISLGFS